ncbi:hypothetical protein DL771_011631 [Monosporascus sp. 5C6A]|nr:hypothetical protein DL771_011631 [Monosporascus sp. 5C6A]
MEGENSHTQIIRPSGIRPPSTIAASSRLPQFSASMSQGSSFGLHEMSDSQSNARAQQSMVPQVSTSLKRGPSHPVFQPDPKRKTLAEKAGSEFPGPWNNPTAGPASTSRSVAKGYSLKDVTRSIATTSTGLSVSRHTTNSSYGSSHGPGNRPASKSHVRARSSTRTVRPATSMDTRDGISKVRSGHNGTMPPPSLPPASKVGLSSLPCKNVRRYYSVQDMPTYEPPPAAREASFCNQFGSMSIDGSTIHGLGTQVMSLPENPTRRPAAPIQPSITIPPSLTVRSRWGGAPNKEQPLNVGAQEGRVAPMTPTPTDIDERLGKFETEFQTMKQLMDSAAMDKDRYVEELDMAKRRVAQLQAKKEELQDDLDDTKRALQNATREIQYLKNDLEKQKRNHEDDCELLNRKHSREIEEERRLLSVEREKHQDLQRQFEEKCGREAEAQRERLERELTDYKSGLSSLRQEKELEVQQLGLQLQARQLQLRDTDEELRKAKDQIEDHEHTISRLNAKVKQLEENARSLQEAYGSSENRKDHQIGDMSRQLQELSKRAEAAERSADEANKAARKAIEASNEEFEKFKQGLKEKLVREEEKRRKLFEQVQDLKGNIRVMCRIRPPGENPDDLPVQFEYLESEYDEDKFAGVIVPTEKDHPAEEGRKVAGRTPPFHFERIFDPSCTNKDVFDEISQLVQSVMDGKKVCIFCYGQTGSGKTYTMSNQSPGGEDQECDYGIIPRAKEMIFREMKRLRSLGWEYTVEGSYLEVYKNKLYDLLTSRDAAPRTLEVKKVSDELEIKDHSFTPLNTEEDLESMVNTAQKNRHVAETNMNRASSRSHSILVLKIHGKKSLADGKFKFREGTLNLIDLAGSESVGRSGATGDVAEEGRQINMSLTHLGTVLKQLGEGRKKESVDFSSYTLTQVLRPSLGERCRTLMFVMVSPLKENAKETISSLKFAENAQKVKQGGGGSKSAGSKKAR